MNEYLIIFYVSIVAVYSYILYRIPNKNYVQMVVLTILTALIILCGQKMILADGKVKRSPYTSKKLKSKKGKMVSSPPPSPSVSKCNAPVIEAYEGYADSYNYLNKNMSKELSKVPKNIKEIVGESLMGPYDGKCLAGNTTSKEKYKWMKEPANVPLLDKTGFVMQGAQGPLKDRISDDKYLTGPHLDGTADTSESMFMFAKNQCKPECCPSSFSCDGGCVCTTDNQREFIARGGVM